MSQVHQQWKAGHCRTEPGIFFADDSGILITGRLADGYTLGPRQPMGSLFEAYSENWRPFEEDKTCRAEAKGLFINAGRGATEATGYVAVIDAATARLVWLAHLPETGPISSLKVVNSHIFAVPAHQTQWALSIPLQSPAGLTAEPIAGE